MTKQTMNAVKKAITINCIARHLKSALVWMLMLALVWNSTVIQAADASSRSRRSSKPARKSASRVAAVQGQTMVVWGPQQVVRQPVNTTYYASFSLPSGAIPLYQMTVSNGAPNGTQKVTQACIKLNGVNVLSPTCYSSVNPTPQIRTVSLQSNNNVEVTLVGPVLSYITITVTANQASLAVSPINGNQGQTMVVNLTGTGTNWVAGQTTASFGGEINTDWVNVTSATAATAQITISSTAALGPRNVALTTGAEVVTAIDSFAVNPVTPPGASSSTVSTLAGSAGNSGFVDGSGTIARFRQLAGLAAAPNEVVYVADAGNHAVRRVDSSGAVTTTAGNGSPGFVDAQGVTAQFNNPQGVTYDSITNSIYVADAGNHSIRRIDSSGNVTTLAGDGTAGFTNGQGAAARFNNPKGIAVDNLGRVLVADTGNHVVRRIDAGGNVTTLAGDGTAGTTDGSPARFNSLAGVAVDGQTVYVYLADTSNHRIRRLDGSGITITLTGLERGFKDGLASQSRFADPAGIAVDGAGHIIIAETTNSLVREIDPALALNNQPNAVFTLAGTGGRGSTDGAGNVAKFNKPAGVAVLASSAVIAADTGNQTLRKILLPPVIASLNPSQGAIGATVTIAGNRFDGRGPSFNTVKFATSSGTVNATVTSATRSELIVTVPMGAVTGNVTVQTTAGTSNGAAFTLSGGQPPTIADFNPKTGPVGTLVTITGSNLMAGSTTPTVTFAGPNSTRLNAPVAFAGLTEVRATVPANAVTGIIQLITTAGTATSALPFTIAPSQDFALTLAPSSQTVVQGSTATFEVMATSPQTNFTQLISLTAPTLASGATATFTPSQITTGGKSTLTIKLSPVISPTSYPFTVQGVAKVDGSDLAKTASGSFTVMASGSTTLSGRVLSTEGVAIPSCTVSAPSPSGSSVTATTDAAGNFLLIGLQAGPARAIFIQPPPGSVYPAIKEPADVSANQSNVVPYTFYLPAIDPLNTPINPNAPTDVFSTRPGLGELKMTIPQGISLRQVDANNNPIGTVTHVSITPVPIDRTPAPLPSGVRASLVYTSQPGNSCVWNTATNQCFTDDSGPKIPVVYPNLSGANPGEQIPLWGFDHNNVSWYQYGTGTVSADGKRITPNAGAGLRDFSWHFPSLNSADGNPGDPDDCPKNRGTTTVDYSTGIKIETITDIFMSGARGGLELTHTFTTDQGLSYGGLAGLSNVYRFGVGTRDNYDIRMTGSFAANGAGYLVLPEQTPFHLAGNNVFTPLNGGRLFSYDAALSASGVTTFTNSTTVGLLGDTIRRIDAQTLEYRSTRGYIMRFEPNFNFGGSNNENYYRLKSIIDRNSNTTTLTYSGGDLIQVTDPVGRTLSFSYSSPNCAKCVSQAVAGKSGDPLQRIVSYTYNSQQQLTTVTDQLGKQYRYTYEVGTLNGYAQTRLKTVVDRRGNTVKTLSYDVNGRVISQTFADGGTERYSYTLSGNIVTGVTIIDQLGRTMTKRFNAQGYVIEEADAQGQRSVIARAIGTNTLSKSTGPCGCPETEKTYDNRGNVLTVKDRLGQTESWQYRSFSPASSYDPVLSQVTSYTDKRNKVTSYGYDTVSSNTITPKGNLVSVTNALNQTTAYAYDSLGRLAAITDGLNHATSYGYDVNGYIISHTDALNHSTTFQYDLAGNLLLVTDPLGRQTRMRYDNLDRVLNVRKPVNDPVNETGNPTYSYTYDENDNRLSVTDANLKTWTFTYDAKNHLVTGKRPLNESNDKPYKWEYDAADQLVKVIAASGRTMRYSYDARGQQQTITDGLGNIINLIYDHRGNVISLKDQRNNTLTFGYDELFRLTSRSDPLGRKVTAEYDPVGNVIARTDRMGRRTTVSYDNINRPVTVTYADATVTYQYDTAGRPTSIGDANGAITWQYDNANRLTSETTPLGVVSYSYNNANQRNSMTAADRLPVAYGYDTFGRLQTISQGSETFTYGYDTLSRRTSLQRPNNVTTAFLYDEVSRLKRLTHTNASTTLEDLQYEFNLDNEINKVTSLASALATPQSKTATSADAANRIGQFGAANYSFNQEGQTTSKIDASGTTGYQWDARGRLTRATLPNGQTADYGYDATGRRISSSVNGTTTTYQYDGLETVIDRSNGSAVDYLNGASIDDKLRQSDSTWGTMYFLQDHLGSTLGLTNAAGGLVESLQQYDAFGASAGSVRTRYGFTGRERDVATGLMHYRARWYDPQQGRFLSEDPIGLAGRDTNLYSYVYNSPTNLFDPIGLQGWGREEWGEFGRSAAESAYVAGGMSLMMIELAPLFPVAIPVIGVTLAVVGVVQLARALRRWNQMCEIERAGLLGGLLGGFLGGRFGSRYPANYCFVAGTKVQTPDGEKSIEDIKVGDKVLSSDPEQGENGSVVRVQKVVQVFERTATEVVDIRIGKETITATPEHPFWVIGKGWVAAGQLEQGSQLLTKNTTVAKVDSIKRRSGEFKVYNFEVAEAHTYYVSTLSVLVHNQCKYNGPPLYRGGPELNSPRPGIDIKVKNGMVQPGKGMSVNQNPNDPNIIKYGGPYKIDLNTVSPELEIFPKGSPGHYEIGPQSPMTLERFIDLLSLIKLIPF